MELRLFSSGRWVRLTVSPEDDLDLAPLTDRAAMLVEAARKAGADASDAVVAVSRSTGVEVRDGELEETEGAESTAFTLRAFVGKRVASVSANSTGNPVALAERCVAMAKATPEDPYAGLADPELSAGEPLNLDLYDEIAPAFDTMKELALACEDAALSVDGVTKSSGASCGCSAGGTVLATSSGFLGSYRATRFVLSVSIVAGEGDGMERDYDFDSCRHFADLHNPQQIGSEAGQRAARRTGAMQMKTGEATVIFEPRVARGLILHLAGAANGMSIARKTSFLREDRGNRVFAAGVTVLDEPHIPRGMASRPFDAEGLRAADLSLADDGILQNWLLDSSTARQLGMVTNARANRAGSGTTPGITNLTMLAGKRSPQDMVAGTTHGLLVTELIGQGVNLLTGDYSRGASGFLIENGEIKHPVSEITIAGNLRDMFARIEPASDLERRYGSNAPTIAIEGMTIAGT